MTSTEMTSTTRTRTARFTRSTARVRPHVMRRNGLVDAPQPEHPRRAYAVAVSVGWRPSG